MVAHYDADLEQIPACPGGGHVDVSLDCFLPAVKLRLGRECEGLSQRLTTKRLRRELRQVDLPLHSFLPAVGQGRICFSKLASRPRLQLQEPYLHFEDRA